MPHANVKSAWVGGNLVFTPVSGTTGHLKFNQKLDFTDLSPNSSLTDGAVMKGGTSSDRITTSTASTKFLSFYFDSEATSGDATGFYNRLYVSGAGGGGDALRTFATVEDVAGATVRGMHCSLSFGTSGSVTGLGVAAEFTLHVPSGGGLAGTVSPIKAAIHSDGSGSDPVGSTLSYIQIVNQGDTDGDDDVDTDAYLLHVQGHSAGTGTLFQATTTAYTLGEITHSLKCNVGGTVVHLLASTTGAQAT